MKTRKFLSAFLALFMLLSVLQVPVLAEVTGVGAESSGHVCDYSYDRKIVRNATCESPGVIRNICECGKYKYASIPAEHNWVVDNVIKAPDCGHTGLGDRHCGTCQKVEKNAVLPVEGEHDWDFGVSDATCTEPMKAGQVCKVCKTAKGEAEVVEGSVPLGHSFTRENPTWDEVGTIITPAACEEAGERLLKCTDCTETTLEALAPLGHDFESKAVLDSSELIQPTCVTDGCLRLTCGNEGCNVTTEEAIEGMSKTGHNWKKVKTVKPTCTQPGGDLMRCENDGCGIEEVSGTITPALNHQIKKGDGSFVSSTSVKATSGTCVATGTSVTTCTQCGVVVKTEELKSETINPDKHTADPDKTVYVSKPNCTTNGVKREVCKDCGKPMGYSVAPASHDWDKENGNRTQEPTCATPGAITYTCKKCSATTDEAIAPTGEHIYSEKTVDATCVVSGQAGFTCDICGTPDPEREMEDVDGLPPIGHSFERENPTYDEKGSIITPASCDTDGEKILKCTDCDATTNVSVEALGHDFISKDAKSEITDANCTSGAYVHTVCGRVGCDAATDEAIDGMEALGHNWSKVTTTAATCVSPESATQTCSRCKEVSSNAVVGGTDALNHQINGVSSTAVTVVSATCVTSETSVTVCTQCGITITSRESAGINPNRHTADPAKTVYVMKPTCTTNGVKRDTCKDCGAAMGYSVAPAAHSWDEGERTTEPTCATPGALTYHCTACTDTSVEAIAPTGNHEYTESSIPEDCLNPAKAGKVCTICGTPEGEMEDVTGSKPLGHDFKVEQPGTPASCTADGVKVLKCIRCAETTETAVKGAHEYDEGKLEYHSPNCVQGEYITMPCMHCDDVTTIALGTGEPLGHKYGPTYAAVASCTSPGGIYHTCTVCKETTVQGAETAATGHKYTSTMAVEPTCATSGYSITVCNNCGEVSPGAVKTNEVSPDASKHVPVTGATVTTATCQKPGIVDIRCKECDAHIKYVSVPVTEHNWGDAVTKEATCSQPGEVTKTCQNEGCGKTETTVIPTLAHEFLDDDQMNEDASLIWKQCKNCDYISIVFAMACELANPSHKVQPVTDEAVAPTDTKPGLTRGFHCGTCGTILIPQEEVAIHEHIFDKIISVTPNADGTVTTTLGCSVEGCTQTIVK